MTLFPQANEWRSAMQNVRQAIDDTMGEPVTVTPATAKPNYPAVEDPTRAVTVTAVFSQKAHTALGGGGRVHGNLSLSPLVSTSKPVFEFGYNTLPFPLRQHYRITLLRTGEVFEVKDVKADGVATVTADVVQLGRQKEDGPGVVAPAQPSPFNDPRVPPNVMKP